ncbi:MAG: CoA transferase [Gammaproteobacteria bacterium]|nr:CoA transferase [Gammaproteobacteria bacterium]
MLEPYRVLDFTDERGELGPMLLGDLGADVIRVEPPGGSAARRVPPDGQSGSLSFQAFNRNKRSIVVHDGDRDVLAALIRSADFLFESAWPSTLAPFQLDAGAVREINPSIVHVRISPFGSDGPRADDLGNDLVVAAMGGPVSLQGPRDRAPLRVGVPQVWRHAGAESAAGALVAHARRVRTGQAQLVDVSAQCVMTWTMLQAMDAHAIQGFDFERSGSLMASIEIVHPCKDGHLIALPTSRVILGLLDWMIDDGVMDASARAVDWETFDHSLRDPDLKPRWTREEMVVFLRSFFARHTKEELFEFGIANGITLAPVGTMPELLDLEHLAVRDYWRELELPEGRTVKSPGAWARSEAASEILSLRRPPPRLNAHGPTIRAELAAEPTAPAVSDPDDDVDALPFAGIKVADFAWVGVGPISAKYLADHGATVVRVESENRPDVLRGGTPFKDAIPGWNRSQFFGDFNTSKLGLALDLKLSEAQAIAKRLIAWSDVMIESFAPGAMARMGLDYEHVRDLNPGIIMVSTCLMGQTGPARAMAGYGYHAAAIAGFYEVTGWPDQGPCGPWTAYTDTIAPRFVSTILAAALDRKRRTGEGCFIDLAQLEAALHFLGPEILDSQVNGRAITRIGNRDRFRAPQGCYPCAGDDAWLAIAVDTDEQWRALQQVIGRAFDCPTNAERLAAHDAIDATLADWTATREAGSAMRELQSAGVPAGMVQRSSDLLADPQYAHRGFYRYLEHGEMGRIPYAGHQYRISGYDNGPRGPAPMLGEHSFEVLRELLGLSEDELSAAFAAGAIT